MKIVICLSFMCSLGVTGVDVYIQVFTEKHCLILMSEMRAFLIVSALLMMSLC